jgi:hypothetical protein
MSRAKRLLHKANDCGWMPATAPMPPEAARIAQDIGVATLELSRRAHDAGLTVIGYLLESVALEAGAEASARRWPANRTQR